MHVPRSRGEKRLTHPLVAWRLWRLSRSYGPGVPQYRYTGNMRYGGFLNADYKSAFSTQDFGKEGFFEVKMPPKHRPAMSSILNEEPAEERARWMLDRASGPEIAMQSRI